MKNTTYVAKGGEGSHLNALPVKNTGQQPREQAGAKMTKAMRRNINQQNKTVNQLKDELAAERAKTEVPEKLEYHTRMEAAKAKINLEYVEEDISQYRCNKKIEQRKRLREYNRTKMELVLDERGFEKELIITTMEKQTQHDVKAIEMQIKKTINEETLAALDRQRNAHNVFDSVKIPIEVPDVEETMDFTNGEGITATLKEKPNDWYLGKMTGMDIQWIWVKAIEDWADNFQQAWSLTEHRSHKFFDRLGSCMSNSMQRTASQAKLYGDSVFDLLVSAQELELRAYPVSGYRIATDHRSYEDRGEKFAEAEYLVLQPYVYVKQLTSNGPIHYALFDPSFFRPLGINEHKRWNTLSDPENSQRFRTLTINTSLYTLALNRRVLSLRDVNATLGYDRLRQLVEHNPHHQEDVERFKESGRSVYQETLWVCASQYFHRPYLDEDAFQFNTVEGHFHSRESMLHF
jgi:hypothetical protein